MPKPLAIPISQNTRDSEARNRRHSKSRYLTNSPWTGHGLLIMLGYRFILFTADTRSVMSVRLKASGCFCL